MTQTDETGITSETRRAIEAIVMVAESFGQLGHTSGQALDGPASVAAQQAQVVSHVFDTLAQLVQVFVARVAFYDLQRPAGMSVPALEPLAKETCIDASN